MDSTTWTPSSVAAALALAVVVPGASAQRADTTEAPPRQGFYTEEQADRGEQAFSESCGYCHSPSQFSGSSFLRSWSGASVGDLYGLISGTMPMDAPGMLSPQQYTDVVAYLLQLNELPAGETELPADPKALDDIVIEEPSGDGS